MEEWVQRIAIYIVLVTVLRSLIGKPQYQQYFRFVSGLILILLLITPVLGLLKDNSSLYRILNQYVYQQDLDDITSSLQLAEGQMRELIREEYKDTVSSQVMELAERQGLVVQEIQVTLDDQDEISLLEIHLQSREAAPAKADLHEFRLLLQQYYQLGEENVVIWI
ncbi:MAG: stage III sporulation protein AF [Lachnospiraceae bacterium]|nr:stage III sporulation protein AF [Lachnospiraceae bacterium]